MYILGDEVRELAAALAEATKDGLIEWRAADIYDDDSTLAGLTVFTTGLWLGGHNFGNLWLVVLADGTSYLIYDRRLMMALGHGTALPETVRQQVGRHQWAVLVKRTEERAKQAECNPVAALKGIHKVLATLEAKEPAVV